MLLLACTQSEQKKEINKKDTLLYLNHADTAKYVGIQTCKLCHQTIYNTFIKTGMGKSFDVATQQKSSATFSSSIIYDKPSDFYYKAFWKKDSLQFLEYRLSGKDILHKRLETVDYIVGSGQHTNSHIQSINGYLHQMPMTFYTQKKMWDMPPGFENGHNTRFNRKIGLECMSCHNNYPDFVLGSENKFNSVPEGISCERCHGPGSVHVQQRQTGSKIDTANYIDYSIVNPAKLTIDAQFDICQRCHLQGNTILKEGKSFYDFKPGMKLSDYMTVFLPKYKHADDQFIMASHADRLKQSQCFIVSLKNAKQKNSKSLKPYKEALTCVTCHNPHVSVKETNKNIFNDACTSCHGSVEDSRFKVQNSEAKSSKYCTEKTVIKNSKFKAQNCVGCHMPKSGSIDIPHVTVHDHYIRKPITVKDKSDIKKFIGLYAINDKQPSNYTKAKAYLNQYEKFEQNPIYLDSAAFYLQDKTDVDLKNNFEALVQLYFIKKNYLKIIAYTTKLTDDFILKKYLTKKSYSNDNAWTCYRIAEAFNNINNSQRAIIYFKQAVVLAPYVLDFKNKLGSCLAETNQLQEAEKIYKDILKEYPKHVSALTNLGYITLTKGNSIEAEKLYIKAVSLDPDYESLLLNLAGLYAYKQDFKKSKLFLERILVKNPTNINAKKALEQLKNMRVN